MRDSTAIDYYSQLVAVCVVDSSGSYVDITGVGSQGNGYCIQLSDSTMNNSKQGAFFIKNDILSSATSRIQVSQEFDPGKNSPNALRLSRDLDGNFDFYINGNWIGSKNDTAITTYDRLVIVGGQDTHADNGGSIDDIYFEGCP